MVNSNQTVPFYATAKTAMTDMEAVMNAAQAFSGEIVLPNLLKKRIFIDIENAGAQRGALISDIEGTMGRLSRAKVLDLFPETVFQNKK